MGWSVPFAPWVVKSWEEHSKKIGGPEVAKRVSETLSNPELVYKRVKEKMKEDDISNR